MTVPVRRPKLVFEPVPWWPGQIGCCEIVRMRSCRCAASPVEEFAARMRSDYEKYGKLIPAIGVKVE